MTFNHMAAITRGQVGKDLKYSEKYLLMVLADMANADNKCWPRQKHLVDLGFSLNTLKRSLKKLKDLGYIESQQRGHASNMITLKFQPWQGKTSKQTVPIPGESWYPKAEDYPEDWDDPVNSDGSPDVEADPDEIAQALKDFKDATEAIHGKDYAIHTTERVEAFQDKPETPETDPEEPVTEPTEIPVITEPEPEEETALDAGAAGEIVVEVLDDDQEPAGSEEPAAASGELEKLPPLAPAPLDPAKNQETPQTLAHRRAQPTNPTLKVPERDFDQLTLSQASKICTQRLPELGKHISSVEHVKKIAWQLLELEKKGITQDQLDKHTAGWSSRHPMAGNFILGSLHDLARDYEHGNLEEDPDHPTEWRVSWEPRTLPNAASLVQDTLPPVAWQVKDTIAVKNMARYIDALMVAGVPQERVKQACSGWPEFLQNPTGYAIQQLKTMLNETIERSETPRKLEYRLKSLYPLLLTPQEQEAEKKRLKARRARILAEHERIIREQGLAITMDSGPYSRDPERLPEGPRPAIWENDTSSITAKDIANAFARHYQEEIAAGRREDW